MLKRFPDYGRRPEAPPFLDTLRQLLLGRIHAGQLRAGDRLPGVREVAMEEIVLNHQGLEIQD